MLINKLFLEINCINFYKGLAAFIPDTVILENEGKLKEHLLSFLDNRETTLKLCYRASVHGWPDEQFHQRCDDKPGMVVLVKVGNWIFGGYTDQTWQGEKLTISFPVINTTYVSCKLGGGVCHIFQKTVKVSHIYHKICF